MSVLDRCPRCYGMLNVDGDDECACPALDYTIKDFDSHKKGPYVGNRFRWKSNGKMGTVVKVWTHGEHTYFDVLYDDGRLVDGWRVGMPTAEDYEFLT